MHVEVTVPTANVTDVVSNLLSRGALIHANDAASDTHVIQALVRLSGMFGYETDLRSRTVGRATHSMTFAHWQLVRDDPDRGDGEFDSLVGAPLRPRPRPRDSAIAMPEPDDANSGDRA
jgi:translation elongation factor EF-G